MSNRRRHAPALVAAAVALALGACSGAAEHPTDASTTGSAEPSSASSTTEEAAAPQETEAVEVVEIPATPVGEQVTWTLAGLVPDAVVDAADAEARLSPAVLAQMDGAGLAEALASVAPTGPWEPISYEGDDTTALVGLQDSTGERIDLTLVLDGDGLIEQLLFQPGYDHVAATSWEELDTAVAALPADTTLVVTDVSDPAAPQETFSVGDDGAFPVGSVFKLYVLGAVTDAVAAGTMAWEDTLTVTDDLKSLPSGELQDAPAGTEVTVREAATQMIAISDNTATDMLIDAVGRETVEAQLAVMGHHDPALNTPLLTTRDLFVLGWGDGGANREAWATGDEAARRAILEALPAGPPAVDPLTITAAVWQDDLDWFATPQDLVTAHLALQEKAETPAGEPLTEILGTNPGFGSEVAQTFDEVAFKGGSSMGVLALTFFVSGPEGDHVITLQSRSADQTDVADARPYFAAAQDAAALLGTDAG